MSIQPNGIDFYKDYTRTSVLTKGSLDRLMCYNVVYFKKLILPRISKNKDISILEIGCGYGNNIKAFISNGYSNIRGVDISEEQVAYAKDVLDLDNVLLIDAQSFFEKNENKFDLICFIDVLEHLTTEDSILILKLARDALSEQGQLLLQVPNALAPLSPYRYGDITHQRAYTPDSIKQSLMLAGFENMSVFELPNYVHGMLGWMRKLTWKLVIKPLIIFFSLWVYSNHFGKIFTANFLVIVQKT